MLIIPLPAKPDWRNPPWVTLLIVALCCVIYFGFQVPDDAREQAALAVYEQASLVDLELPRYLNDLEQRGQQALVDKLRPQLAHGDEQQNWVPVLLAMQDDRAFMARLRGGEVIRAEDAEYVRWRLARQQFDSRWQSIFTLRFALHPASPEPIQLLMHVFMHADVDHLLGNMVILFMVAYTVESLLGAGRFLAFYLLAGLGAALPDLLWPGEPGVISLGASGAIAGVMAMFVVLYGLRRIRFFYWVIFYFNTALAPALLILPYWLGNEVWQRLADPSSHVNYWAHFAGLLSGAGLTGLYRLGRAGRTADKVEAADVVSRLDEQRTVADAYLRRLEFTHAARAYAALSVEYPGHADLVLRGFRAASMQNDNALLRSAIDRLFALSGTNGPDTAKAWVLSQQRQLKLPALSGKDWLRHLGAWIDTQQFEAAEQLLPKLLARDQGLEAALPALIYRLGLAHRRQGNEAACQAAWRLLLQRYPDSPEVRLLTAG